MIELFVGALLSVISIISYIELRVSKELRPNSGTSIKDKVNKLETQMEMLLEHLKKDLT
jgi:hypothetical protein